MPWHEPMIAEAQACHRDLITDLQKCAASNEMKIRRSSELGAKQLKVANQDWFGLGGNLL